MTGLVEVRTKLAQLLTAQIRSIPRLCWPFAGLSVRPKASAPAVLDRLASRPSPDEKTARHPLKSPKTLPFLSDVPLGCPKGRSRAHHDIVRTRKGVPTNGPARPVSLLRPSGHLCQAPFWACLALAGAETRARRRLYWAAPVPNRLGISTFTPGPPRRARSRRACPASTGRWRRPRSHRPGSSSCWCRPLHCR